MEIPEMHDTDGYPTDEFLKWIEDYDVLKYGGFILLKYVMDAWWPDGQYGCKVQRWYKGGRKVMMSTWGWSGNESLIAALQSNLYFWDFHYFAHQTGGHYTFRFTKKNTDT